MFILKLTKKRAKETLKITARAIRQGRVAICPTDTIYGLIADATNKKAVEKVFRIKNRDRKNHLPIFVKDLKTAKKLAFINKKQEKIIKKSWPGKTTFVLNRKKAKIYGVDKKTIALRIPNHKIIRYLLSVVSVPLTGTSANISGKPVSIKINKIISQFRGKRDKPDLVVNAGNLKTSKPSSIIDLTEEKIKVLRK